MMGMVGRALTIPNKKGELIKSTTKAGGAFIHGDAEEIAGYDIPIILDGDLAQFDQPEDKQDILMMLPTGDHPCIAKFTPTPHALSEDCYLITLKK